jgi:hypothetical protein
MMLNIYLMEIKHNVSPVRDQQAVLPVGEPLGLILLQLIKQARQMDHHTIACSHTSTISSNQCDTMTFCLLASNTLTNDALALGIDDPTWQ